MHSSLSSAFWGEKEGPNFLRQTERERLLYSMATVVAVGHGADAAGEEVQK